MRALVVGAGAVGGYFGGRLIENKRDVTFLVRPKRASELVQTGLQIRSRKGDISVSSPNTVLADQIQGPFDLILLTCKAYDLENAIASFAPAVGPDTAIVPLLNGMRHLDMLSDRFGAAYVLGGVSRIAATLNEQREIIHLNEIHGLSFGELDVKRSARVEAIEKFMAGVRFDYDASTNILLDMWEKWVFLAALAGGTCLMRSTVGVINAAPGGRDVMLRLLEECRAIAASEGYAPREAFLERTRTMLTTAGSPLTASMLRDIENNAPIEADHVIGDLLRRSKDSEVRVLPIVFAHLKCYENRRA